MNILSEQLRLSEEHSKLNIEMKIRQQEQIWNNISLNNINLVSRIISELNDGVPAGSDINILKGNIELIENLDNIEETENMIMGESLLKNNIIVIFKYILASKLKDIDAVNLASINYFMEKMKINTVKEQKIQEKKKKR